MSYALLGKKYPGYPLSLVLAGVGALLSTGCEKSEGKPAPPPAVLASIESFAAPAAGGEPEIYDRIQLANKAGAAMPLPPTRVDVFLADLRLVGFVDVLGIDIAKEKPGAAEIEKLLDFYAKTDAGKLRGYRPYTPKAFIGGLSAEQRSVLAGEVAAHLRSKGVVDPNWDESKLTPAGARASAAVGGLIEGGLGGAPPAKKWLGEKVLSRYPGSKRWAMGTLKDVYGRYGYVQYDNGAAHWVAVDAFDPPLAPEPIPPGDACAWSPGDKLSAPYGREKKYYPGVLYTSEGRLAFIHFSDGDKGLAYCEELKPR